MKSILSPSKSLPTRSSANADALPPIDISQIDRSETESFILALTGDLNTVLDWAFFPDVKKAGGVAARCRGTLAEVWDRLAAANADGCGIFVTINESDGQSFFDAGIVRLRAAAVDDDKAEPPVNYDLLKAAGLAPSISVGSGNGEHHYWLLKPGEDLSDFTPLQKALAAKFGTDPKISNLGRVMRVPGFLHLKDPTDPFLVWVIQTSPARYTVREIVNAFGIGPEAAKPSGDLPADFTAARPGQSTALALVPKYDPNRPFQNIQELQVYASTPERIRRAKAYLSKVPPAVQGQGGDSQTLAAAMIAVRDFDLDDESAEEALEQWNATCRPPWSPSDLILKIRNARHYGQGEFGSKCADIARRPPGEAVLTSTEGAPKTEAEIPETHQATIHRLLQTRTEALLGLPGLIRTNIRSGEIFVGDRRFNTDEGVAIVRRNVGRVPENVIYKKDGDPYVRSWPAGDIREQLVSIANANSYDPVRDLLDSLPPWDGVDRVPALFACLCVARPQPIYITFLRNMLVAAVARVYEPGCKSDSMVILHADGGGEFKSTFYRTLAGDTFFSDDCLDITNKDAWALIGRFWFVEFSEMEALRNARSRESTKAFLSRATDTFRAPYAHDAESHPRRTIFVGTTNQKTLLENDGGNRRFQIIADVGTIDIATVSALRTRLWSQAIAEYRSGARWWLSAEDTPIHEELQQDHIHEEVGVELIAKHVATLEETTVDDLLTRGPELFRSAQNKRGQMAVTKILKSLGWESVREARGSVRVKVWRRGPAASAKIKPTLFSTNTQAAQLPHSN
jgi:hypothetical protein